MATLQNDENVENIAASNTRVTEITSDDVNNILAGITRGSTDTAINEISKAIAETAQGVTKTANHKNNNVAGDTARDALGNNTAAPQDITKTAGYGLYNAAVNINQSIGKTSGREESTSAADLKQVADLIGDEEAHLDTSVDEQKSAAEKALMFDFVINKVIEHGAKKSGDFKHIHYIVVKDIGYKFLVQDRVIGPIFQPTRGELAEGRPITDEEMYGRKMAQEHQPTIARLSKITNEAFNRREAEWKRLRYIWSFEDAKAMKHFLGAHISNGNRIEFLIVKFRADHVANKDVLRRTLRCLKEVYVLSPKKENNPTKTRSIIPTHLVAAVADRKERGIDRAKAHIAWEDRKGWSTTYERYRPMLSWERSMKNALTLHRSFLQAPGVPTVDKRWTRPKAGGLTEVILMEY